MNVEIIVYRQSHNPYFNRWFSAIKQEVMQKEDKTSHNPYFNRWFSAIQYHLLKTDEYISHNPYFNRWFSAIWLIIIYLRLLFVTILILIDGFLQ